MNYNCKGKASHKTSTTEDYDEFYSASTMKDLDSKRWMETEIISLDSGQLCNDVNEYDLFYGGSLEIQALYNYLGLKIVIILYFC